MDTLIVYCENCGRSYRLEKGWPSVCTCGCTMFSNVRDGAFEPGFGQVPAGHPVGPNISRRAA